MAISIMVRRPWMSESLPYSGVAAAARAGGEITKNQQAGKTTRSAPWAHGACPRWARLSTQPSTTPDNKTTTTAIRVQEKQGLQAGSSRNLPRRIFQRNVGPRQG